MIYDTYIEFNSNSFLSLPVIKARFQAQEREQFVIVHSSAVVAYSVKGFRVKNMDRLEQDMINLFAKSENPIMNLMFADLSDNNNNILPASNLSMPGSRDGFGSGSGGAKSGGGGAKGNLIGSQFSRNMEELMDKLHTAKGHFVRCIKPNSLKRPKFYEPKMVLQQLRSLSVLEAIDLRRRGYAYRTSFKDFVSEGEYFPLLLLAGQAKVEPGTEKACCQKIVDW
jgi:myosin heavy subunit